MNLLKMLLLILFLKQNYVSSDKYKLIYQNDISEHCRRRVVPSIFLGRQVVDANARVMQFSRLDLPYSCFISIRTESGSNMVMVIQLDANALEQSCKENNDQLMVYDMGETFGGYWGPLPDLVMRQEVQQPKIYSLKTTPYPESTVREKLSFVEEESDEETTEETSTATEPKSEKTTGDYIEVEVPLLNVSVQMVPGVASWTESVDFEAFDLHNDVTPISGVPYDTSVLPLVQFRIEDHYGRRREDDDEAPKYELDIVQEFTPDMRLTLPQLNPTNKRTKSYYKQKYQATRRLNFKKHKMFSDSNGYLDRHAISQTYITRKMNEVTKYTFPTMKTPITEDELKYTQDSWQLIKDLINKLNKAKESPEEALQTTSSIDDTILMEKISNMTHNISVYLSPNLSLYSSNDANKLISITRKAIHSTWEPIRLPIQEENINNAKHVTEKASTIIEDLTTDHSIHLGTTENTEMVTERPYATEPKTVQESLTAAMPTSHTSDSPRESDEVFKNTNVTDSSTFGKATAFLKESRKQGFDDSKTNKKILTGSMVGHESWENVVQAAPEMAVLLNQNVAYNMTNSNISDDITGELNETPNKNKLLKRKKKAIHSISIEEGRPRNLTTKKKVITTTKSSFEVADMQEFAQLVELQDDELHGHVALRYPQQYVGRALFNLCDLAENPQRHVHLFNSSRIVLAINNFSLERMIVILTAARTLLNGEPRCPRLQLECQVAGARVCLDSMAACDGVPNCGSYDIYDEDRLMCGQPVGLQHNVYLAAFTFLAVLLTGLYAVHYWLKRCVPKVADAFFVYSDGVENVLILDSIMRSPNETEDMTKMANYKDMFGDENIYDNTEDIEEPDENRWQRFLRKWCFCWRKKNKRKEPFDALSRECQIMPKKMFSFTELEIRKMLTASKDTAVQTGDSLEMKFLEKSINKHDYATTSKGELGNATTSFDFPIVKQDSLLTLEDPLPEEYKDELSLLKFFNVSRTVSMEAISSFPMFEKKVLPDTNNDYLDEKEIKCVAYDRQRQRQQEPVMGRKRAEVKITPSSSTTKQLRFDDVTTTIPSEEYDDDDDNDNESNANISRRRNVALGETRKWRGNRQLDTIVESDEHSGVGKEHRHFWGSRKAKKSKKKANVSLR